MLRTCSHCGIVSGNHICPYRKTRKKYSDANDIRKTNKWHKKSLEIRERDNFLCRVCLLDIYDTKIKYNSNDISVHHITPLEEDNNIAFNDDNLISLCRYHHELAEIGKIPREELNKIVVEDIRVSPLPLSR